MFFGKIRNIFFKRTVSLKCSIKNIQHVSNLITLKYKKKKNKNKTKPQNCPFFHNGKYCREQNTKRQFSKVLQKALLIITSNHENRKQWVTNFRIYIYIYLHVYKEKWGRKEQIKHHHWLAKSRSWKIFEEKWSCFFNT